MKKVIILKGLPASGKTTYAKKLIDENPGMYKRVNKDDLRAMLDNGKWSKSNENLVLKLRDDIILAALADGKSVIVDDTNLAEKHVLHIQELVKGKAVVETKFFEATVKECIERDLKRSVSVGEKVIRGMWEQFLKPQDEKLPHAIICDLDGTLALLNGRNPYDASTCEQDGLNEPVAQIIGDAIRRGLHMIFVSGREDKYRNQTKAFIVKHLADKSTDHGKWIFSYMLHMRKSGDKRKDSIIKREIFDEHIFGNFYVEFVLDDRNQVVEMWRELGLTCFQVAEGNF
jgi:predicted kinase